MVEYLIALGYVGLFIACFISGTIIPFSSDIILITLIAVGFDYIACLIVASVANSAGEMVNYYIGRMGKTDWIERFSNIKPEKVESMKEKISKRGAYIAFFSWVPGIGNLISISLGYLRYTPWKVALGITAGKTSRYVVIIILTLLGVDLLT